MKLFTLLVLVLVTPALKAADFFLVSETLPESIKHLSSTLRLPENNQYYKTPLGVTSRCFKGNHFLILSENELGIGYELTHQVPDNVECTLMFDESNPIQNQAGMFLGMQKEKILEMLKVTQPTEAATLLYNREVIVDNKKVDEQTWIDVEFANDKLILLKIFTSVTN